MMRIANARYKSKRVALVYSNSTCQPLSQLNAESLAPYLRFLQLGRRRTSFCWAESSSVALQQASQATAAERSDAAPRQVRARRRLCENADMVMLQPILLLQQLCAPRLSSSCEPPSLRTL